MYMYQTVYIRPHKSKDRHYNGQTKTMVDKILYRKLKIEQHDPHKHIGWWTQALHPANSGTKAAYSSNWIMFYYWYSMPQPW